MSDPPLTPAQLLYLEAFDAFLLGPERAKARAEMSKRLNFVLAEANVPLPGDTRWTDALGRTRDRLVDSRAGKLRSPHGPRRAA